jgi:hypothetical protein
MISPEIKSHSVLQDDVTSFLDDQGFLIASAAYHDVMRPDPVRRLQAMRNLTALYVRARADRVAIHKRWDLTFQFELKTNTGVHQNMAIEALPLAHHIASSKLGNETLYIYRGEGVEGGFWASDPLPIECLKLPSKWQDLRPFLASAFPGVRIDSIPRVSGSGDPFIVISKARLPMVLVNWRDEIKAKVELAFLESEL